MENGQQIDTELQQAACSRTIAAVSVQNLQDLLDALDEAPPSPKCPVAMLHTTAKLVSDSLNKGLGQIEIDELVPLRPRLKLYLQERRYPYNSVKSYLNYARMLVEVARHFGWVSHRPDVTKEWEIIRQSVWQPKHNADQIVKYAISIGRAPALFTDKDLEEWCALTLSQGRALRYVRDVAAQFCKRILRAGADALLPNLSFSRPQNYGQPLSKIPQGLRTQIEKLIKWKTDEVSEDRNPRGRNRPVSALKFQHFICRLYGFVSNVQRQPASNLRTLCSKKFVFDFVNWCRKERQVKKISLYIPLNSLYGIVRNYPYFKRGNFEWLGNLIAQLKDDEEDEFRAKEARKLKSVDYDSLEGLPEKMRREAAKTYTKPSKQYAAAMRDALLMEWLVTLPWRQRNLREMRIGRQEDGANIFKAQLSTDDGIARPGWLVEELRRNPNLEVWQFRFRARETKTNHFVHGILPKQIAVPLEEYVNSFRPLLISGSDPGTVFLNDSGRSYTLTYMYLRVTEITFKYFRRPVNPHLFRHIYATKFLEEHPENYLTLSKILWHRDVKMTIRLYGAGYDESHGARAAEEWRDQRAKKK
jgi:hypothetical protein